jgi:hypothetical protein
MSVTLDGQILFDGDRLDIEPDSVTRDSVEKAVPGLDGVLSIDLGSRTRMIKQKGVLRAKSRLEMDCRISAISAFMDGSTHNLVTDSGRRFDNLRMDIFKLNNERTSGGGIVVDYEIVYTQLNF